MDKAENMDSKAIILELLVSDFPINNWYRQRLRDIYRKLDSWKFAALGWKKLVRIHPFNRVFRNEFTAACKKYGGLQFALDEWTEIIRENPGINVS
jgi:hypothetical protein